MKMLLLDKQASTAAGCGRLPDFIAVLKRLAFRSDPDSNHDILQCHKQLDDYYRSLGVFTYGAARMGLYEVLAALEIGVGDEVIVPGYTCAVVVNAVRFTGATPIYADIELSSLGADTNAVENAVSPNTKAIVAHHLFGIPCDIEKTIAVGDRHGVPVIEDAAMAMGGRLNGRALGTFGIASILSCERTKIISTGNGGVLLVHEAELADRISRRYKNIASRSSEYARMNLQRWALHYAVKSPMFGRIASKVIRQYRKVRLLSGKSWKFRCEYFDDSMYTEEYQGIRSSVYPFLLSNEQAWLLRRQLRYLEDQIDRRNELAKEIETILTRKGAGVPDIAWEHVKPSWLRYPFWVDNPEEWSSRLEKLGIQVGNWFEGPIHPLSCCDIPAFGYQAGNCPNGEWLGSKILNIPLSPRFGPWLIKRLKQL